MPARYPRGATWTAIGIAGALMLGALILCLRLSPIDCDEVRRQLHVYEHWHDGMSRRPLAFESLTLDARACAKGRK